MENFFNLLAKYKFIVFTHFWMEDTPIIFHVEIYTSSFSIECLISNYNCLRYSKIGKIMFLSYYGFKYRFFTHLFATHFMMGGGQIC